MWASSFLSFLFISQILAWAALPANDTYNNRGAVNITIIHINDIHARFEETNVNSLRCREGDGFCFGGIARICAKAKQLLREYPEALFFNAGDLYLGTVWYSIFKYRPFIEVICQCKYSTLRCGQDVTYL